MAAITFDSVTKHYGSEIALEDLSLTVNEGEVYGFLGPNGAGKSTSINILLNFIRPTSGEVRVFDLDAQDDSVTIRNRTGVLPEGISLYDRLSGRQHVQFAVEAKSADDDPDELLDRVGLADAATKKVGGYSKGMLQRLAFATALAGQPDLLLLDEPTTGLDPTGAHDMREIIREERDRGATVFFSSHILGQVEAVCDRVAILRDGTVVTEDTVDNLRKSTSSQTQLEITLVDPISDPSAFQANLKAIEGVSTVLVDSNTAVVGCTDGSKPAVLRTIEANGVTVESFETDEPSLEDVFMAYTTEESR
ncbi:ATP-binding cassette domain-containing protein [Natrarchaeobius sp. A-rgal3]|uniref:ABC transporter ATP-binding protein n=1 Tax=Natrarchaeobius versutus TaxID=1679078 RepID=UPI00350EE539